MSIDKLNSLTSSIEPSLNAQGLTDNALISLAEKQNELVEQVKGIEVVLPDYNRLMSEVSPILPAINEAQKMVNMINADNFPKQLGINRNYNGLITALDTLYYKTMEYQKQINAAVNGIGNILVQTFNSPFFQWIQSIDFNPIVSILTEFDIEQKRIDQYENLKKAFLQAMYECKWFPYAGWPFEIEIIEEVSKILSTSKGVSQRREKKIDKVIFAYYTYDVIKHIKQTWRKNTYLPNHIKKVFGQAIDAYLRKEYALTISSLAIMWEGLLKDKLLDRQRKTEELKHDIKELFTNNGFEEIISDFYNNLIIGTCYSVDEVIDGIPNRNGIAHGWYKKYPNKKSGLNAILLTDFIINLRPNKQE